MMRRVLPLLLAVTLCACGGDGESGAVADGAATPDAGSDLVASDAVDAANPDADAGPDAAAQDAVDAGPDTTAQDTAGPDAAPADADASPDASLPDAAGPTNGVTLGTVALDPTSGLSQLLSFTVPTDAVSFAITAVGGSGIRFAVEDLRAPDNQVLMPAGWSDNFQNAGGQFCLTCLNRGSVAEAASATMVPMAPTLSVAPGGTYSFQIFGYTQTLLGGFFPQNTPSGDPVSVSVGWKTAPSAVLPATGIIDLNLHFTGSDGLNAGGAPFDTRIKQAMTDFAALYAQAGITIGRVTYRDIDPMFQVIDGYLGPDNDFELAARQTQGAEPGVNLIFVRDIVDSTIGPGAVILGISGGIPGPIGLTGSGRSAVIVDGSPPAIAGPNALGLTMAHEVGHFLGLYHSTENSQGFQKIHDPIPDTPEDDASNLMYFMGGSLTGTLSPQQSAVMRGNPWIRNPNTEAR